PYRTAAGILDVTAVGYVDAASITDADARNAGYPDARSLVADLRGDPEAQVIRIDFVRSTAPDPRAELAADADLDDAALAEIDRRLNRLDRAARYGPWTRATLRLVAERPMTRAGDLAASLGRERAPFKLDVRKLKALGLTESLAVGYRLSPRGAAYLDKCPT
ncbi:MAG: hypothetical protein ACRDVZ_06825, partial [Jiangellaceae bacterium]